MEVYVGHRHGTLLWVSNEPAEGAIRVPAELEGLGSETLLSRYHVRDGAVVERPGFSDPKLLKAAFISVYRTACGISTYSEWLWPELGSRFKEFRIFAEYSDDNLRKNTEEPNVVRCWKRGMRGAGLVAALREFRPDVVYIQHEWGIFPSATSWLSLMSQLQEFRTIVCFHSVYRTGPLGEHADKIICEAAAKEIIVHTNAARDALLEKGFNGPISVIPHGALLPIKDPKPWNRYGTKNTIIQFGFGFRYKGWEDALRTVAQLKTRFPDVFYTGLFTHPEHAGPDIDQLYLELQALARDLGIEDNIALIRGFQTEAVLHRFLSMNRVALFPYVSHPKHEVLASTGAARLAMAHRIPIVTSRVPLFDDLSDVSARGSSPDEYAELISRLLTTPIDYKAAVQIQDAYLEENSWAKAADRYLEALSKK